MRFNLLATGRLAAFIAGTALVGAVAASPASAAIQAGTLRCNIAGGLGAIVGSQKAVTCTFRPNYAAPTELYTGTLSRLGVDISSTSSGVLTYEVLEASNSLVPFSLAGTYIGAGAGLAFGAGLGIDGLVGGNNNQVALQPLVVSTSTGVGINAGVGSLTLVAAGMENPPMMHHHHHRRHHRHHH